MSELAIRVEHLGKKYRLGGQQARYSTFREALVNAARAPLGWLKGGRRAEQNILWALDDVSFEVRHGEAVGIIGRNGAGKSTLLKILARITSPTRGRVDIFGRVGALLEVGTGFHPELTGRENIFLNGAILGMTRREIDRKFDEIVDFAEIEKFLDTPVKFYSSGMYVRLAFAVAAYLEPEILVVDEVLAVGDAAFQKKCLGKMGNVAKEGRTVLFVSHNMAAVQRLCDRCLVLEAGRAKAQLPTNQAISVYLQMITNSERGAELKHGGIVRVKYLGFTRQDNQQTDFRFSVDEDIVFRFNYELRSSLENVYVGVWFLTAEGFVFMSSYDADIYPELHKLRDIGEYESRMKISAGFLNAGEYTIRVLIYEHYGKIYFDDSSLFIQIDDAIGESANTGWGHRVGQIIPKFDWEVEWHDRKS
jgi:lipopolysaccharide transport system ATP-binding protein